MRLDGSSNALLHVENLAVGYASAPPVLGGLSLILQRGESVGLMGPSGSGKTTLAHAIAGLLPGAARVSGQIRFSGQDLLALAPSEWRRLRGARLALLSQEPAVSLTPHLRVGTQIAEVLAAHGQGAAADAPAKAATNWLAEFFGLAAARIARAYPHELSGGERQRAAIARAVCCRPDLLIADEPTASLDTATRREVLDTLRQWNAETGMALLLISHQARAVAYATSRCLKLDDGRIAAEAA
ncbi:MAG: ABC transporter ATP-binding protein [Bryobacterales bacterium]|nr:ABC transporter ATP-binding protein [Bryobacterales bacterium]